ncbi:hypothetical protein LXA43DRAFT_978633 [Ganoderma leucocontextum]|nr:hypothetical protein LXA43DRAFT_978633 [Ganoderma leucocontextum]
MQQEWSTSPLAKSGTLTSLSSKPGTLRIPVARLRDSGYTRLRDTVPCKTLGGLDRSDAGRLTVQPVSARQSVRTCQDHPSDVEAEAAAQGSPTISDPDSTLSYPEWIRPYLPTFREQAKQEWNVYRPQTGLVAVSSISPSSSSSRMATPFPVIVVQPCNDALSSRPGSLDSVYSVSEFLSYEDAPSIAVSPRPPQYTPCLVLRSRGERVSSREVNAVEDRSSVVAPASPDMASPVSFYFPTMPTFCESAYLQVPSTSCDSPPEVEEADDEPQQAQTASRSGATAVLQRTQAFKAKDSQDRSGDVGIALTSDRPLLPGAGRGLVIATTVGLRLSSDPHFGSGSVSNDTHGNQDGVSADPYRWDNNVDDSSRDSTIRFSDVLGDYRCSISSSDSAYSNISIVSNSSRTSDDSLDSRLHEIIDLYRRRDTYDETSSLHRVLDGWVTAVTRKDGPRLDLGSTLPYGPPRNDYGSVHSPV